MPRHRRKRHMYQGTEKDRAVRAFCRRAGSARTSSPRRLALWLSADDRGERSGSELLRCQPAELAPLSVAMAGSASGHTTGQIFGAAGDRAGPRRLRRPMRLNRG